MKCAMEKKMYVGLTRAQKKELEFEVISERVRLNLARLFREVTRREDGDSDIQIILKNRIINIARQIEGLPLYRLESDSDGYYFPQEEAWHFGELELISRRPETKDLIEILCDLIQEDLIPIEEVNNIFLENNSKIIFIEKSGNTQVEIENVNSEPDEDIKSEHPNIRKLIKRMEVLFNAQDYSGVLHTSASVFETLAKDVIKKPTIEDKSLGSFFESYKKHSKLSEPVLDMIKLIYDKRSTEPLAGHGQTAEPTITREEAAILMEMTKAFVRMERKFAEPEFIK